MQQLRKMILNVQIPVPMSLFMVKQVVVKKSCQNAASLEYPPSGAVCCLKLAGLPETLFESEIFGHEAGALPVRLKSVLEKLNMQMVVRYSR